VLLTNRSSVAAALYELPLSPRARAASGGEIRGVLGVALAASCGQRSFVLFLP
jgi:hypothetical protein